MASSNKQPSTSTSSSSSSSSTNKPSGERTIDKNETKENVEEEEEYERVPTAHGDD